MDIRANLNTHATMSDAINESLLRAYQVTFGGPDGQIVLNDLALFCRANATTFDDDPRRHALLEGRRETFLRIQQFAKLHPDDVLQLAIVRFAPATRGEDE